MRELDPSLKYSVVKLLNCPIDTILPLKIGGNSLSYEVQCNNGKHYFLKKYFNSNIDLRDRQKTERDALIFLNKQFKECVPNFIAADLNEKISLFEWIDGDNITEPKNSDLKLALDFLSDLKKVSGKVETGRFDLASEACLSCQQIIVQINRRINQLKNISDPDRDLEKLIEVSLLPTYFQVLDYVEETFQPGSFRTVDSLDISFQILSPSDFGFHNIRRRANGKLVFFDFEYFGWDDPVKLVADFILHPAHKITYSQKKLFYSCAKKIFSKQELFANRFNLLLPLYEIRWCLIMLNPFIADYCQDRGIKLTLKLKEDRLNTVQRRLIMLQDWYDETGYEKQ